MSPRRRATADDPLEKTGYRLPRSLVLRVREAVDAGDARSQNEFVERAVRRELESNRKRRLHAECREAASAPVFMAELRSEDALWDETSSDGSSEEQER